MTMTSPRKVIVLDDDHDVNEVIAAIAEDAGFEVEAAFSADEFFKIYNRWKPSHVIIDLMMPDTDGVEVLRLLSEAGYDGVAIVTTAADSRVLDAAARAALERGLDVAGVLIKPFHPEDLQRLLHWKSSKLAAPQERDADGCDVPLAELEAALAKRQFEVFYQPKIKLADLSLDGFEGVVRWQHPRLGLVMPDNFIPAIEAAGLMPVLTKQVFEMALRWFAIAPIEPNFRMALNISSSLTSDPHFPAWISEICAQFSIDPKRIILEITETSKMEDQITSLEGLNKLRLMGFSISIDDFGVGYSSLVQLARFPFSEMKIDKSFVSTARDSLESRKIVLALIGLAHALKLTVTAEGVEDEWSIDFLRDAACDSAQGYFIARPLHPASLAEWVEEWGQRRVNMLGNVIVPLRRHHHEDIPQLQ